MTERRASKPSAPTYGRDSVEFGRALAFTDGVYAIAATLLVISIAMPAITDHKDSVGKLAGELNDLVPQFISFLIGFAVIGRYWLAHHQFIALLSRITNGLIGLNLIYLVFIAFLPFPTALLGNYFENPLSVTLFAANVAGISAMEVVLFRYAYRNYLMTKEMPADVYRWSMALSLSPVLFFLLSIPVAFFSTPLAVLTWFLAMPFQIFADRYKPAGADDYYA